MTQVEATTQAEPLLSNGTARKKRPAWDTENARKVLAERYLKKNEKGVVIEDPSDLFRRVAQAVAEGEAVYGMHSERVEAEAQEYYEMMEGGRFQPNSPTLMNAGLGTNMTLSGCFVLPIGDSVEEIFEAIKTTALVQRGGGGTGFCLDRLRPTGDRIRTSGGVTSGPISFWRVFAEATNAISQGSRRRGANMMQMGITHPDILKFIFAKTDLSQFTNFNISVKVPDAWMDAFQKDPDSYAVVVNQRTKRQYVIPHTFTRKDTTIHNYCLEDLIEVHETTVFTKPDAWTKRQIFDVIVNNAFVSGEPGVVFPDRWNETNPTPNVGEYEATNPCVPAGTRILTQEGYVAIETRVGKLTTIWNGWRWSQIIPEITGHNQPLIKVTLNDGSSLICTEAHKWVLADGSRIPAIELVPEDALAKFEMPIIEGGIDLPFDAYTHGVYTGDGQCNGHSRGILLYGEKQELMPYLKGNCSNPEPDSHDRIYFGLDKDLPEKGFVPINASLKDRLAWLAGFIDTDGSTATTYASFSLIINNNDLNLLTETRLLLTTLGIQSKVSLVNEAKEKSMPDGKGGKKVYWCERQYRLVLSPFDTARLVQLGLTLHRIKVPKVLAISAQRKNRFVVSTEPAGVADVVYCFNEPLNHTGTFEGIVTAQCGEQVLLANESCNLGSINLAAYIKVCKPGSQDNSSEILNGKVVDWDLLAHDIHLSTRFLENVVEINKFPTPEIDKLCRANRKIGLGIMGFADALYHLGVGYNTDEGLAWGERFMRFVNTESHNESERLARERGCFSNWKGSRWETEWKREQRNACCTTVAPTGTISIFANCSGGLEPLFSLAFTRQVMPGHGGVLVKMFQVNDVFDAVAKAANYWGYDRAVLYDMIETDGSLHRCEKVPDSIKQVFVCAHDIAPEWHIRMQAAFQKHCDSSISKTTNFPHDCKPEDIRKIYDLAYELGCKGVTVYRDGCRANQPMALKESAVVPSVKVEETPEFKAALAAAVAKIKPTLIPIDIPDVTPSIRIRQKTSFGNMHIHVTVDLATGKELELFAQLGKGGEVAAADLEAICRVVSLHLRCGGSLQSIIEQLDGIGSTMFVLSKDGKISSLGDGLAKALRRYLETKEKHGLEALLLGKISIDQAVVETPVKTGRDTAFRVRCQRCEHGQIIKVEGCEKCTHCEYTRCG